MAKDVENNRNEWDPKRGNERDNKHNVVGNKSPHLHCILLHKHTSNRKHWDKTQTKGPKNH